MKKQNKIIIILFIAIVISITIYFLRSANITKVIKGQDRSQEVVSSSKIQNSVKKTGYWSTVNSEKPVWIEKDPSLKTPVEVQLSRKLEDFLMKQFSIIYYGEKKTKQYQSKISWIANYISNNEVWYKSDFHDDLSDSRMTIFFNYYNCKETNPQTKEFVKCFTINLYNFRNDNWYEARKASYEDTILWRNNTAYVQLYLDYLGDFTRHTNAWMILIPMPRDSMPIYYIRQENNKPVLEKGPDSDWVLTDQKEFDKFQKWTQGYKVKHGETPEP